ncbi:MAG: vanadium-dependent haloperoxidase [Spirosomataceae bacterium]
MTIKIIYNELKMPIKLLKILTLIFCLGMWLSVASQSSVVKTKQNNNEITLKWAKTTLDFINIQTTKSPTFISRSLGYIGLTMYESVVYSNPKYKSIASQLNGLADIPKPQKAKQYDWETVLNASQSLIIRKLWQPEKSEFGFFAIKRLDSLEKAILKERELAVADTSITNRSVVFGKALANRIYEWSMTDGGHEMNFKSFDPEYKYHRDSQNGLWDPPVGGQSPIMMPLHPYWGNNRSFVKANADLPVVKMIPFSRDTTSDYYQQFRQVYNIQKNLTQEQKEIANWWGDDPAFTTAPPGHSYNITIILIKAKKPDLVVSAMAFARVGMACADAFINCWKNKYVYHSERPKNYIRKNIDKNFNQYWPEPPFPGFPSGHSTQMAATAEVLIDIFGDKVSFIDDTHRGRPKDSIRNVEYKSRSFTKISQIADECGISRLYGGIHTMQDNLIGLEEGKKIGENINKIKWR